MILVVEAKIIFVFYILLLLKCVHNLATLLFNQLTSNIIEKSIII